MRVGLASATLLRQGLKRCGIEKLPSSRMMQRIEPDRAEQGAEMARNGRLVSLAKDPGLVVNAESMPPRFFDTAGSGRLGALAPASSPATDFFNPIILSVSICLLSGPLLSRGQGRRRTYPWHRVPCPWFPWSNRGGVVPAANPRTAVPLWDLEPLARDCGYTGAPYGWGEERRFQLRCELDAAFFCLSLGSDEEWARDTPPALREKLPTPRHAIEHIMDSFPIVKRKDEEAHGEYRWLNSILLAYDAPRNEAR